MKLLIVQSSPFHTSSSAPYYKRQNVFLYLRFCVLKKALSTSKQHDGDSNYEATNMPAESRHGLVRRLRQIYEPSYNCKTANVAYPNIEARSRNHCCRGKAISIYIFFSYAASKAHASCCIAICSHSCSTIFLHIISQTARFLKEKKSLSTKYVCFDFLYNFCLKHLSFQE